MTDEPLSRSGSLVRVFDRYGHHDHDCEQHDVFVRNLPCSCGFNEALQAALDGAALIAKPPIHRQAGRSHAEWTTKRDG